MRKLCGLPHRQLYKHCCKQDKYFKEHLEILNNTKNIALSLQVSINVIATKPMEREIVLHVRCIAQSVVIQVYGKLDIARTMYSAIMLARNTTSRTSMQHVGCKTWVIVHSFHNEVVMEWHMKIITQKMQGKHANMFTRYANGINQELVIYAIFTNKIELNGNGIVTTKRFQMWEFGNLIHR